MSRTCVSCRLNPRYCVPTTSTSDPPSANRNFKNASKNTHNGLFAPRACYILHGVLVLIHIVLLFFCVRHWEHHVTFSFTPTNNDFWPVVLSASLQAFYTIYTAVLLFLTQRLAISRTLVRRVKLTAVHDISGAWAGLGSALSSVWQQTDVPSSWWTTSAVAAYLASITVLHVTSSTLLQFQTFNASMTTSVPTTLGWLNDSSYSSPTNLGLITLSLPVVNQLTGLASAGLSNTTLYDTLKTNGMAGNAIVNATTVTSRCGLIQNVTYSATTGGLTFPLGSNSSFMTLMDIPRPDQIYIIPGFENGYSDSIQSELNGVFLMVSTLLEIDPSLQDEVVVPINITSTFYSIAATTYVIQVYFIQCSLSATIIDGVVDIQTNSLQSPTSILQPSTSWEMKKIEWSSTNWQAQISSALAKDTSNGMSFNPQNVDSVVDEYIMSLIGLNPTEEYRQYMEGSARLISNFTLRPDALEFAVAKAAAQLIWLAGQMGTANGGIDPGNGTAYVNEEFISLRLNINLLPLAFAASASVIMLGLALHMTRAFDASHDRQARAAIPNIGVLQLLWLGHRSASINEVLEDVQHPTEADLRRVGMIDVCFSNMMPDEGEFGSSTASDSLSCDEEM